jgi:hypothetical protein
MTLLAATVKGRPSGVQQVLVLCRLPLLDLWGD